MKLKDIRNPKSMDLKGLTNLFKKWFPNGISKEEGWILWSIFNNNNRDLYLPSNEIIETGTFRWFGSFLSEICNEESDYIDFYMANDNLDFMDIEIIKKVHRIVQHEIELIEDYWKDENNEILELLE